MVGGVYLLCGVRPRALCSFTPSRGICVGDVSVVRGLGIIPLPPRVCGVYAPAQASTVHAREGVCFAEGGFVYASALRWVGMVEGWLMSSSGDAKGLVGTFRRRMGRVAPFFPLFLRLRGASERIWHLALPLLDFMPQCRA